MRDSFGCECPFGIAFSYLNGNAVTCRRRLRRLYVGLAQVALPRGVMIPQFKRWEGVSDSFCARQVAEPLPQSFQEGTARSGQVEWHVAHRMGLVCQQSRWEGGDGKGERKLHDGIPGNQLCVPWCLVFYFLVPVQDRSKVRVEVISFVDSRRCVVFQAGFGLVLGNRSTNCHGCDTLYGCIAYE